MCYCARLPDFMFNNVAVSACHLPLKLAIATNQDTFSSQKARYSTFTVHHC